MFDATCERLRAATTAELSDAIDTFTTRRFVLPHTVRLIAGARLFGPAVTIMTAPTAERAPHKRGDDAIRAAAPGSVIIGNVEDELDAALWGAEAFALGRDAGVAGFVTDGAVRQLGAAGKDLAVFAAGRSTVSGYSRIKIMAANVRITCGDVDVSPGDLIAGDADGVVVIPTKIAGQIAAALGPAEN